MDLTRITTGKLAVRQEACDTHALIDMALDIVRDEAQAKGLRVDRKFGAAYSGLQADPARLQQVIWNLLQNAVKFTPPGGVISLETANTGAGDETSLEITVRDTGVGIAPEALEKIFAPFEQASSEFEHRFGGLGLGLAIAKTIVELHRGTIHATSDGQRTGSTFVVRIPGATHPPEPAGSTARAAAGSPKPVTRSLRILLVEDHEHTLRVLSTLLRREGHKVTTVASIAAALAAAKHDPPELLISDLGLPDGTGIELMEQLRSHYGIPGIALSGYGMEKDLARSRAAGFALHLIKPLDFDQLRRAVGEVAGKQP